MYLYLYAILGCACAAREISSKRQGAVCVCPNLNELKSVFPGSLSAPGTVIRMQNLNVCRVSPFRTCNLTAAGQQLTICSVHVRQGAELAADWTKCGLFTITTEPQRCDTRQRGLVIEQHTCCCNSTYGTKAINKHPLQSGAGIGTW